MMADRTQSGAPSAHVAVQALLPWYLSETLSGGEREHVRAHLADCAACRAELERCRAIAAYSKADDADAWSPSPAHFARVMANIDAAENGSAESMAARRREREYVSWIATIRGWIVGSPAPVQWALAVQGVLLIGGAIVLANMMGPSRYEKMSLAAPQAAGHRAQLRVVFGNDVSMKELGELLHVIDAQIVAGPTPTGVYNIALPFAETDAAGVEAALAMLRASPKVQLAERNGEAAAK